MLRDSATLLTDSEDRFRPVFFSLLYLWRQLGFSGEVGLRLLPLLFGLLQLPVAFVVGRKLLNEQLGLLFAALIATSPILIEFSQELRMYSLVALLGLVQLWCFLVLRERWSRSRGIVFVVVALLGVYTHLHYWLLLAGFALSFWRERRQLPLLKSWGTLAATFALYLPNLSNVLRFTHERGGEYAMHFASALPKLLAAFVVGYNYFALPEQGVGRAIDSTIVLQNSALILLAALPVLWLGWRLLRMQRSAADRVHLQVIHDGFTIPVLLALLAAAITGKNWLQPKYLIFSAPPLLLALAFAGLWLTRRWQQLVMAGFGVVILGLAIAHFYDSPHFGRREDWRGAAAILERDLGPETRLVMTPGTWWMLDYYGPGTQAYRTNELRPPRTPLNEVEFVLALRRELGGVSYAYYLRIDTIQNDVDPYDHLPESLDMLGPRVETWQLNPRVKLIKWQLR
ncbi:glycosyltransferase family 39 protein [candidate division KSB1 bacterium]|nr:glycosyltransferase family 39 protein [candidate division KSB1 bacterium]